ncbi:MAG: SH3 domain-containing protein [Devosia sp.]|nr:SH3 domain-containing protein [Devosia sp.]
MARRGGFGWGWILLLLVAIGGFNALTQRSPSRPEPSERVVRAPNPAVVATPSEGPSTLSSPIIGYVTANNLNVRREPSTSSAILLSVPRGTKIVATSSADGWLGVALNDGSTGWISADFVSSVPPAAVVAAPVPEPEPEREPDSPKPSYDRNTIVQAIIQESIWSTGGSCPCPYNTDRGGRRCGGRSAYSRPGGASPICFADQVTQAMIDRYLARN